MSRPTNRKTPQLHSLEAHAYYQGAHGVDLKPGLEEIQSNFDEKAANISLQAVERQKRQEALLDHTRTMLPQAEEDAAQINQRIKGQRPQWLFPLVAGVASIFMVLAEIVILAPCMDALQISNRVLQFFTAAALVLASSLIYHLAWESLSDEESPVNTRIPIRVIAIVFTCFLIVWGILRGNQVAFSAKLAHSRLGDFLSGNGFLASAFYVLLTAVVPIVIGTVLHYAVHHLKDWHEWRTANARLNNLNQTRINAQKQLDTEREQHQHALKQLAHECAQWKATYRLHHERGAKYGAIQEPMAMVYLKSAAVALVAGSALFWAPLAIPICATLASGICAFQYFRRKREHPNPDQFYEVQHVNFVPRIRNVTPIKEPPLIEATVTPTRRKKGLLQ